MKSKKHILFIFACLIAFFSTLGRLSTFGFFYPIGLFSVLVFGIFHVRFLIDFFKNFEVLELSQKIIAWISILVYPLIFLFQFDLEEFKDAFYVYEFLTGKQNSDFEYNAFYIAIGSGIIYLINYVVWQVKLVITATR